MTQNTLHYKSVIHFLEVLDYPKSPFDNFAIINLKDLTVPNEVIDLKVTCEFYCIMFNNAKKSLGYGAKTYDLTTGAISFVAPNQLVIGKEGSNSGNGWVLCISPSFLKPSLLQEIDDYILFSYEQDKALVLDETTEDLINDCVARIQKELETKDSLSQDIICSEISLILTHCLRNAVAIKQKSKKADLITKVEKVIEVYYQNKEQLNYGIPSVSYLSEKLNLSSKYFSKLVHESSGIKTTDFINKLVIEKSKILLLSTDKTVQTIAYDMGYSQSHHFNRLFKKYNGVTPKMYRDYSKLNQ